MLKLPSYLDHRSPEIILPIPEIIPEELHHHYFPEFQPNSRVKMVIIPEIPEKIVIIPGIPEQFSIIPETVIRNSGNRSGIPEKCLKNNSGNSGNSGEW